MLAHARDIVEFFRRAIQYLKFPPARILREMKEASQNVEGTEVKLESTTYHYAVKPPEGPRVVWPDLKKTYSKSMVYRPDNLSFDVHVTAETGKVKIQNVRISGCRVLKDGLSDHRVSDVFSSDDHALPGFAEDAISWARAKHGRA